jgi:hypothetical protein
MPDIKDGGPAFPTHPYQLRDADGSLIEDNLGFHGLTKREVYALGAMIVHILVNLQRGQTSAAHVAAIAKGSFTVADAILKEGQKDGV